MENQFLFINTSFILCIFFVKFWIFEFLVNVSKIRNLNIMINLVFLLLILELSHFWNKMGGFDENATEKVVEGRISMLMANTDTFRLLTVISNWYNCRPSFPRIIDSSYFSFKYSFRRFLAIRNFLSLVQDIK